MRDNDCVALPVLSLPLLPSGILREAMKSGGLGKTHVEISGK
jgi:hypothetical protein